LFPFVGALVTPTMKGDNFESFLLGIQIPIGLMLALNEHVGIDIGLPLTIKYSPRALFYRFELPVGYFGVRAFF